MPLVFVHGVNVRLGDVYSREVAFRDRHFVEIFYRQLGREVMPESILNPYWGDLGATISADKPFLPRGGYEMLWRRQLEEKGLADDGETEDLADLIDSNSNTPLLDIARTASLSEVIDVLWDLADHDGAETGADNQLTADDMARLAQRALNFCHSEEGEKWLATVTSDEQLLERLATLLSAPVGQAQAIASKTANVGKMIKSAGGRFKNVFSDAKTSLSSKSKSVKAKLSEDVLNMRHRIRQKAVGTSARIFNDPMRAIFHQQCALLIGDAFAYFSDRGTDKAAPMAERVMDALRKAQKIKEETGEELIVVGHSMGGVIMCDIVTCYGKDIPIDILITVGSQYPLFADLQMFPGIRGAQRPIPRPENVGRWINIFDPNDFLGYPASHTFEGVEDFHLPTYAVGASAHANYFNRRSFYFQLARRLHEYVPLRAKAGQK